MLPFSRVAAQFVGKEKVYMVSRMAGAAGLHMGAEKNETMKRSWVAAERHR